MKPTLKVNFKLLQIRNIALFKIQIFLKFLRGNLKNHEHESCSSFEKLQYWFWTKVNLSNGLKFIFLKPIRYNVKDNLNVSKL